MFDFARWLRHAFRGRVRVSRRRVLLRRNSMRLRLEQLEDRLAPAVTVTENFAGISGGFSSTNNPFSPPDTIMAAGPNETVEAVNTSLIVKDKAGNTLTPETQFSTFFSSVATPGDAYSDPYVLYDSVRQRFVVGILEFANNGSPSTADLDFAVSRTSDPATGGWNVFQKITKVEENNTFPDFPKMGSNADAVYVSFNQYDSVTAANSSHNQILTIPWSSILGTANDGTLSGLLQTDIPTASDWNILIPARMDDMANGSVSGGPEYYVASDIVDLSSTTTASDITVYKETNVLSATPTFTSTKINVNPYDASPGVAGLTNLVDSRMLSVDVNNGKLAAAGNVGLSDGLNHARWYELDVSGATPSLLQQGDISPGSGLDTSYPGIAIDPSGNIGMTFVQSGNPASGPNWQTPSMYVTAHLATDAANFMEAPIEIKAGVLGATVQGQRGGDYSAAVFDPTSDSFFAANEFTSDSLSTDDWGTQIAQFTARAWKPIGPAPIFDGQTAGGLPVSGRITGIATDPKDANTIYIAAAGGGIWKTTNGGAGWTPLTDNLFDTSGNPIPVFMGAVAETSDTSGNQIVYAGTGEANNAGDSFYGEGILVSKNGGTAWTLTTASGALAGETVSKIVIDPSVPTGATAYAAVSGNGANGQGGNTGIWKTINFGQTWTNVTAAAPNNLSSTASWSDVVIDPNNHLTLYAAEGEPKGATGNGVYKSTDGGNTWTLLNGTGTFNGTQDGRISLAVYDNGATNELFVSIANPTTGGLFKMLESTNGGTSFTDLTTNVTAVSDYLSPQGWYDTTLAIDPLNSNYIYAAGVMSNQGPTFSGSPLESFDGGTTWHDIATDPAGNGPHTDAHAVAFDNSGNLYDGDDGGIFKLTNPTSQVNQRWSSLNTNLQITQFTGIAVDTSNDNVWGGSQDNGTEKYSGPLGWAANPLDSGDGGITRVDPTDHTIIFQEYVFESLRVSFNGGSTFSNIDTTNIRANKVNFYAPYVLDASGNVYYGTDYLNLGGKGGLGWSQIGTPGINGFNPNDAAIDAIAVSSTNNNVVYVSAGGHMFVTKNAQGGSNNVNWTEIDLPAGLKAGARNSIAVDPSDTTGGTAYAVVNAFTGGGKHVFKTTNFGGTWIDISGNLPDTPVDSVTVSPDGKTVWVGTDAGVYDTTNGGTTWNLFGTGLANAQVVELQDVPSLNLLVVGTHGRGAWELSTLTATAPSITTNPSNQTVAAFNPATFTAAASGNPAPTVQWQDSTDGGKTWNNISGATSTTLTLTNVLFALNGNEYRAVFTNSAGSVATNAATLKVTGANVTTTANNATAVYSPNAQSLQLSATVTDTSLPPQTVGEGTVNFTVTDSKGNTIGTAQGTVSSGTAKSTLNLLAGQAAGSYTIAVSYSDSTGNFADSGDTSGTLTINAAKVATTAVNATAVFSPNAHSVQLSATLSDTSITTDTVTEGTVNFTVTDSKGNTVGTTPGTVSSGAAKATLSLPAGQAVGNYTIAVSYSDSAGNFTDSGDTSNTLTINAANVTTTANAATTVYSPNAHSVQLSATLSDTSITTDTVTEGTVNFTVTDSKGNIIGTAQGTVTSGTATANNFTLPAGQAAGSYTIAVSYSDSAGNFTDTSDTSGTLTVKPANVTTTAIDATAVFSPNAQSVQLSANLSDTSITTDTVTEGTVNFTVIDRKGNTIGTAQGTVSSGKAIATLNLSAGQTAGNYTIAVSYTDSAGNFTDNGDTRNTLTIKPANVTTTAVNATAVYSPNAQKLSLSANLSDTSIPADTVGEGVVNFVVTDSKGNTVGTAQGTVTTGAANAMLNLAAGQAAGSYTIAVSYTDSAGNFSDNGDTSGTLTIKAANVTTTAVNATAFYSPNAHSVQLSATLADTSISTDTVTEGTVNFVVTDSKGNTVGTAQGTVSNGTAKGTLNLSAGQAAGNYTIAVSYTDSAGNFTDNGDTRNTLTIKPANVTTTAVNATAVYSPNAQKLSLSANLSDTSIPADTIGEGVVNFTVTDSEGNTVGTAQGTVSGGAATANNFTLPTGQAAGSYTIAVSYKDSAGNFTDTGDTNGTLTVKAANVTTTANNITAFYSPNAQTLTLSANVADASIPTDTVGAGNVTFTVKNGSTTIGSAGGTVTGGKASASLNLPAGQAAGNYTITVSYSDSAGNFTDTSDTGGTLTVKPASVTTTAGSTSTTYSTADQTVAFSANVADASNTKDVVGEGVVTFTIKAGSTVFGSVQDTVSGGAAHAQLDLPAGMNAGDYTLAVSYSDGLGNFLDSGDANAVLSIAPAATTVQLTGATLAPNLANLTVTETLTAHVGSSTSVMGGAVTFALPGQTLSANVDGNGNATVTLSVPILNLLSPQGISINYTDPANNLMSSAITQTETLQLFSLLLPSVVTFGPNGEVVMIDLFGLILTFTDGQLTELDFGSIHLAV